MTSLLSYNLYGMNSLQIQIIVTILLSIIRSKHYIFLICVWFRVVSPCRILEIDSAFMSFILDCLYKVLVFLLMMMYKKITNKMTLIYF